MSGKLKYRTFNQKKGSRNLRAYLSHFTADLTYIKVGDELWRQHLRNPLLLGKGFLTRNIDPEDSSQNQEERKSSHDS